MKNNSAEEISFKDTKLINEAGINYWWVHLNSDLSAIILNSKDSSRIIDGNCYETMSEGEFDFSFYDKNKGFDTHQYCLTNKPKTVFGNYTEQEVNQLLNLVKSTL